MKIDSKDFCGDKQCPYHSETVFVTLKYGNTFLRIDVTGDMNENGGPKNELVFPIPCIMCSKAKRIDFSHITRKMFTSSMLMK